MVDDYQEIFSEVEYMSREPIGMSHNAFIALLKKWTIAIVAIILVIVIIILAVNG